MDAPYRSPARPVPVVAIELSLVWAGELLEVAHLEPERCTVKELARAGWTTHAAELGEAAARAVVDVAVERSDGAAHVIAKPAGALATPPARGGPDVAAHTWTAVLAVLHGAFLVAVALRPEATPGLRALDEVDRIELARRLVGASTRGPVPALFLDRDWEAPAEPDWLFAEHVRGGFEGPDRIPADAGVDSVTCACEWHTDECRCWRPPDRRWLELDEYVRRRLDDGGGRLVAPSVTMGTSMVLGFFSIGTIRSVIRVDQV